MNNEGKITQTNSVFFSGSLPEVFRKAADFAEKEFEYNPNDFTVKISEDEDGTYFLDLYFSGGNGHN